MEIKHSLLITALAFPLVVSAYPGGGPGTHGGSGNRIDQLEQSLGLSELQKTELQALFEEQRRKFKAIHDETRIKMEKILTPEQMQKMQEIHMQHGKKPKHRQMPQQAN